jgi:single-strand DNA-binding protein
MNCVQLVGNLGNDPELRTTGSGTVVGSFSLATESRVKVGDNWEKKTEWHKIIVFGKTAENCGQYLSKGKKAAVTGRIQYRSWEDKEGNKRYTTEIVANDVEFLSPRDDSGDRSSRSSRDRGDRADRGNGNSQSGGRDYETPDDDDIPF